MIVGIKLAGVFFYSWKGIADKAKLRVIGGRLLAVTGGRPTAPNMVQAGKATPTCRNCFRMQECLACREPNHSIHFGRHYGVQARVRDETKNGFFTFSWKLMVVFGGFTWTAGLPKQKCF